MLLTFVASAALAVGLMPAAAANAATDQGSGAPKADAKPYVSAACGSPQQPGFAQCFAKIRTNLQHQVVAQPH